MSILLQNKAGLSRDRLGLTQLGAAQLHLLTLLTQLVVGPKLISHTHTHTY